MVESKGGVYQGRLLEREGSVLYSREGWWKVKGECIREGRWQGKGVSIREGWWTVQGECLRERW